MSQFIRTRIRCAVYPGKIDVAFISVSNGQNPKLYKGSGVEFELAFFDLNDQLFDISNIAAVSVLVKPAGNPTGAAEMLKTVGSAGLNPSLTLDQWQQGTSQHALIIFAGTETAIAAGNHDITIYGTTNDDQLDQDVFGVSSLTVKDAGQGSGTTIPPLSGAPAVDLTLLNAMLGNFLKTVLDAGQQVIFTSPDGTKRRRLGVANDGARTDSLEDNS